MAHEKFHYKSLEEVQAKAAELGLSLPFAADTSALTKPLTVRNITFPNRMGIAPMEGAPSGVCQRGHRRQRRHLV